MKLIKLKILIIFLFFWGCAGHSTISPKILKKGQTYQSITYSFESVTPVYIYRKGLSNKIDIGFKLGLPYGSGVDFSQLIAKNKKSYYILNWGYSWALNPSYDFTLFKMTPNKRKPGLLSYYGIKGMMIPNGISNNESMRLGMLIGSYNTGSYGYEIGFFHDFSSMPLESLFSMQEYNPICNPQNSDGCDYINKPHSINGLPTEFSRLTGFSLRINFPINEKKSKRKKIKNK